MIIFRFIHVAANAIIFFLIMFVYMYHIIFIHSFVGGYLGCLCFLAIINSAAIIIGLYILSFVAYIFLNYSQVWIHVQE